MKKLHRRSTIANPRALASYLQIQIPAYLLLPLAIGDINPNRFILWEAQFRNKSYDEDDEKKRHILDETLIMTIPEAYDTSIYYFMTLPNSTK